MTEANKLQTVAAAAKELNDHAEDLRLEELYRQAEAEMFSEVI